MTDSATTSKADMPIEMILRDELAGGDIVLGTIAPIMGHLLANQDNSLFSDELVSRVRAMIANIAEQLLIAYGQEAEMSDPAAFASLYGDTLACQLTRHHMLLRHCHALALEIQLADRLEEENGIDRVLSPLLQELIASEDERMAAQAMAVLAAQARFIEQQRRMVLPLAELPGDIFHNCLQSLGNVINQIASHQGDNADEGAADKPGNESNKEPDEARPASDAGPATATATAAHVGAATALQCETAYALRGEAAHAALGRIGLLDDIEKHCERAAKKLRASFDEAASRLGLLTQLVMALGGGARAALALPHGGLALFLSALAEASEQERDLMVIATSDRQTGRLVLALRAAGLKPEEVQAQFYIIHPNRSIPDGIEDLRPDRAASMLQSSVADGPLWGEG